MKYRKNQDVGLFDKENTLQELLENGNPLPKLKEIIDFEQFRDILEPVFENTGKKSNAGRKPIDPVFMFRVLFLQRLYGLSDAQIEYHIKDRTSFRDFLGIQSVDDVPDEKTVWKYKDALAQNGTYDEMFKDQAHTKLHGVCRQSPRLQGDGACADGAAQGGPRRTGVARRRICWDGGCGESETHDSVNLRERHERSSVDGGAEGAQPPEVEGAEPRGACLRIHGADNGRFGVPWSWNGEGKSQYCTDKPCLQHVPTGTNQ